MNLKTALMVLGLWGLPVVSASAGGLDFLQPKKYSYLLGISPAASYQLMPGDYLEVNLISGPAHARRSETILKKVQIHRIIHSKTSVVHVSLAMNEREVRKLQQALRTPQAQVALRIVQKQPRPEMAAAPDDVLPDLDFETTTDLAQHTGTVE